MRDDVYAQISNNPSFLGKRILDIGNSLHHTFLNNIASQLTEITTDAFSTFPDSDKFDIITYFTWDIPLEKAQASMDKIKTLLEPGGFVYIGGTRDKFDPTSTEYEYLPASKVIVMDNYPAIRVTPIPISMLSLISLIRENFTTVNALLGHATSGIWIIEAKDPK